MSPPYLDRLENDFSIIQSIKPFGSKPNSKTQKYEIIDPFLNFWFRFDYKYQSYAKSESFSQLKTAVQRDCDSFAGVKSEQLYREIFKEMDRLVTIGRYCKRGNKNEIDVIALDEQNKEIWMCEVKTNAEKLSLNQLIHKSKKLTDQFSDYQPVYKLLSVLTRLMSLWKGFLRAELNSEPSPQCHPQSILHASGRFQ